MVRETQPVVERAFDIRFETHRNFCIMNRRPLKTRSRAWAQKLASRAAGVGLSPNTISCLGVLISALGAWVLLSGFPYAWFIMALAIQLRLLCNMLDGLVAIEHDQKGKLGDVFNEVPDRIEDTLFLVSVGVAAGSGWSTQLGWLVAVLAVSAAYVRLLGGSLGFEQDFCGPFAKPQRMFFLTVTCLVMGVLAEVGCEFPLVVWVYSVMAAGTLITIIRRLRRLAKRLNTV
jgi:phosphatidylglycerophosphate synthase